ncbi:DUF2931 family protein [Chryseobacterium tructae]|uniref:DUF2931 family protein n=1 Tax=Chryseobacterium tructae TaxID=1037380 RepID=A0ABV7XYP6_9FLAO|nr:DUF2931 family protein [Chryseobacterium tructae]MDN3693009.1 DUF2931 family protein [Chryseobacterium tructae]
MNNRYEWLTLTTADMGYPMEIKGGTFYDEKYEDIAGIPADMTLSSQWWSGDSGVVIAGDQYRPVPFGMKIRWFSYAEDKFYEGDFKLDYEKLSSLFKEGLKCKESSNYKYFKVSIAPGGQVFLYLLGGNSLLVGSYQAKEYVVNDFKKEMHLPLHTEITRNELVNLNIKEMPLQTQQEISEKRINTKIWKDINLHYPWKYTFKVADFNNSFDLKKQKMGVDYINGEEAWCISDVDYLTQSSPKAIPLEIDGEFETSAGRKFTIRIYPGNVNRQEPKMQPYEIRRGREQELVKLFKDFYTKIGKKDFEIHLKLSPDFKTGKVYLKKDNVEQEIPKVQVDIFDMTFDQ